MLLFSPVFLALLWSTVFWWHHQTQFCWISHWSEGKKWLKWNNKTLFDKYIVIFHHVILICIDDIKTFGLEAFQSTQKKSLLPYLTSLILFQGPWGPVVHQYSLSFATPPFCLHLRTQVQKKKCIWTSKKNTFRSKLPLHLLKCREILTLATEKWICECATLFCQFPRMSVYCETVLSLGIFTFRTVLWVRLKIHINPPYPCINWDKQWKRSFDFVYILLTVYKNQICVFLSAVALSICPSHHVSYIKEPLGKKRVTTKNTCKRE